MPTSCRREGWDRVYERDRCRVDLWKIFIDFQITQWFHILTLLSWFRLRFSWASPVQLFEGRADSAEQAVPAVPETQFADDEILRATLFSGWWLRLSDIVCCIVVLCLENLLASGGRWSYFFLKTWKKPNVVCWLPRKWVCMHGRNPLTGKSTRGSCLPCWGFHETFKDLPQRHPNPETETWTEENNPCGTL
jgi:hypothetical protein